MQVTFQNTRGDVMDSKHNFILAQFLSFSFLFFLFVLFCFVLFFSSDFWEFLLKLYELTFH